MVFFAWHVSHIEVPLSDMYKMMMMTTTKQVALRKDQYPFSFIYTRSDVNVTYSKDANHRHHHHLY
jgi:hypothetical protein